METTKNKSVWIGLATVKPHKGSTTIGKAKIGFVNILGFVIDENEFIKEINNALNDLELTLVEIEDVEPFAQRTENFEVETSLMELAMESIKRESVVFGTFHTYSGK